MPIDYKDQQIFMRDIVSVDEAEGLLGWLQDKPRSRVNLADCIHMHPANLQVLMAADCRVSAWPQNTSLRAWLETVLRAP